MSNVEADLAEAGLELLRDNLSLTVHDGALPLDSTGVAPPYVLVYTTVEWPYGDEANGLDARSGTGVATWYCHCVGSNATAARAVANQVRSVLLDVTPAVAGRVCGPIRQTQALSPTRDDSTGRTVMDAVTVWSMESRPA